MPVYGKTAKLSYSADEGDIVINEAALLAFVKMVWPTEVETETVVTSKVRAAFRKLLFGRMKYDPEANVVIDDETGVVLPFASWAPPGEGRTTLTFEKAGRGQIADTWQTGRISLAGVLQLADQAD